MNGTQVQRLLFSNAECPPQIREHTSSTFADNMRLPVHRWFRFSAGFGADWAEQTIRSAAVEGPVRVLDPFAGSGTALLAAENVGVESYGIEAHPFLYRIAARSWRGEAVRSNSSGWRRRCLPTRNAPKPAISANTRR